MLAARVHADGVSARPLLGSAPPGEELAHVTRVLSDTYAARGDMYRQADVTVPQGDEAADATAARVLASLDATLAADDTRERLRRAPEPGSVKLEGGRSPKQI